MLKGVKIMMKILKLCVKIEKYHPDNLIENWQYKIGNKKLNNILYVIIKVTL